ncbi:hypothetical protein SEEA0100_15723, partial [Salmonella enterica subsp. enterica serovar Anatum str. USDA 100]|uniref:hypothetical protein n=1 Tax=Salmonella enterica TaxID=28901 RepID=UPI0003BD92E0
PKKYPLVVDLRTKKYYKKSFKKNKKTAFKKSKKSYRRPVLDDRKKKNKIDDLKKITLRKK